LRRLKRKGKIKELFFQYQKEERNCNVRSCSNGGKKTALFGDKYRKNWAENGYGRITVNDRMETNIPHIYAAEM